ncbi:MAG TPA: RCC1 domain-containing protein, partial [Verrucomicrobiae bacterium]
MKQLGMSGALKFAMLGLLCSTLAASAANHVIAWGNINYDFEISSKCVRDISAGSFHSLAIQKNRRLVAWGQN